MWRGVPTVSLVGFQVAASATMMPIEHHDTTGGVAGAPGTCSIV